MSKPPWIRSVLLRTVYSILDRSPEHLVEQVGGGPLEEELVEDRWHLLAQVVLVDDASTMEHLQQSLDDWAATQPKVLLPPHPSPEDRPISPSPHLHLSSSSPPPHPPAQVKVVRAGERVGLIRARLLGARHVTAPVITYLDSHCECTEVRFGFV